jgi:hypothetical protein
MDLDKFLNATLVPRQAEVEVPELAGVLFGPDEAALWTVRGLTSNEIAHANAAAERADSLKALVTAMAGEGDKATAIRNAMGLGDGEVHPSVSRGIELLTAGSVTPTLGQDKRDVAVKLSEAYPALFYRLTRKIDELSGLGAELGKRKRSGETPT